MQNRFASATFLLMSIFWHVVPPAKAQSFHHGPKDLPEGVLKALATDEKEYCDRFLGSFKAGCHDTFRANLEWAELKITPGAQVAILIENKTSCGIAGCWLGLFVQSPDGKFSQVLGTDGEIGVLKNVTVLKELANGHFNIEKTWKDSETRTVYRWNGARYAANGE
jgi:hypothetical protein